MHVPFLDLSVSKSDQAALLESISSVLEHGKLIQGPEHDELEKQIAKYCNRRFCVAVGSGTDALYLTFKSLNISQGHEVITTPLSWIASTNAFYLNGALPVFADIDETLNIDPHSIESLISPKTKAILSVDYAGSPANYKVLQTIAERHNLLLIEDGSQAFGASRDGDKVGSFGIASCISMNPMKPLAATGEAGVILTDDQHLYDKLVVARYSGMVNKEVCYSPSLNCRMDTLQAAVILTRLPFYHSVISRRQDIAKHYRASLSSHLEFPVIPEGVEHAYYLFLVSTNKRDLLFDYLNKVGIEARIRDNMLISNQPCYASYNKHYSVNATAAVNNLLALPAHEKMTDKQIDYVVHHVKHFFEHEDHD